MTEKKKTEVTMIREGLWEMKNVGRKFRYRLLNHVKNGPLCQWDIYAVRRDAPRNGKSQWKLVESGYRSRIMAAEICVELAEEDDQLEVGGISDAEEFTITDEQRNPVKDTLENIDDGINLNDDKGGRGL